MREVESRVEVVQQLVPSSQSQSCGLSHLLVTSFCPHPRILVNLADVIVRAREGTVGAQDKPPPAQFGGGVPPKAANVGADETQPKEVELEHANDGLSQLLPARVIVAQPVGGILTRGRVC